MPYFNFEDLGKIKKDQLLPVLRVLKITGLVVLAIIVGAIVYFQQRGPKEVGEEERQPGQPLTVEEKIKILESLAPPPDAPKYTNEEKRKILESLASPPDQPVLSDEEKRKILESLRAPGE